MNDKDIISHYKEYFLKIIIASGGDAGDIDNPNQIAFPPIEELALAEVNELRIAYEEALAEKILA